MLIACPGPSPARPFEETSLLNCPEGYIVHRVCPSRQQEEVRVMESVFCQVDNFTQQLNQRRETTGNAKLMALTSK